MNKNIVAGIVGLAVAIASAAFFISKNQSEPIAPNTPTLSSGVWIWGKTVMNDDSIVTPKKAGKFTLTFSDMGVVSGTTDCNGFGGEFTIGENNAITFGDFFHTEMYCEGSQEEIFRNAVLNSDHYLFNDAGHLILNLKYDSGAVHFMHQ